MERDDQIDAEQDPGQPSGSNPPTAKNEPDSSLP